MQCVDSLLIPILTAIQCLSLPAIDNGNIQYAPDNAPDYDLGTVATYTCNEGFVLDLSAVDASAIRTCVDDNDNDAEGIFDRQAPICVRKCIHSACLYFSSRKCDQSMGLCIAHALETMRLY